MIRTTLALLTITVLLTTVYAISENQAFAKTSKFKDVPKICGDKICDSENSKESSEEREQKRIAFAKGTPGPEEVEEEPPAMEEKSEPKMEEKEMREQKMEKKKYHGWQISSDTITSMQDPGIGHETHQLAIILPPSENIYKGILSYSASEPIQLVALHGPLAEGEDAGQAIWTPDGQTKFALTFIDPETAMGGWVFTGNALAVHTMNQEQFSVSYTVSYMEKQMSETVSTATISSMQDPGIGHETHQLAIILPPSENPYSGLLTYSASEPIQLVSLHGPLGPGDDAGQAIWTPDGQTKFGLTFVDNEAAMGTWTFAGNALAVHTMNENQFTVSYSVVAGQ